jgi:hypothetical protein
MNASLVKSLRCFRLFCNHSQRVHHHHYGDKLPGWGACGVPGCDCWEFVPPEVQTTGAAAEQVSPEAG